MTTDKQIEQERLYVEGDSVTVQYDIYPGPRHFETQGRVMRCISPKYYEVKFVDHRGQTVTKRIRWSQIP